MKKNTTTPRQKAAQPEHPILINYLALMHAISHPEAMTADAAR